MQFTLAQIAKMTQGQVHGDPDTVVTGVASLETAQEGDLSFAENEKWFDRARQSPVTALVLPRPVEGLDKPAVLHPMPKLAFGIVLGAIARQKQAQPRRVHETAVVAESATLGEDVSIGHNAVVGENTIIGNGVTLYAGAFVGDRCAIGDETVIHANVSIREEVAIGKRCIIHCGAVVGADGYGYVQYEGQHVKIPQVGNVIIGDDVEIGAMTTIDRAAVDSTIIGNGVKMDNHCHVAHNCIIGDHSLLVAYTRMGGSCRIGKGVVMGADVRMVDNVKVGDGAVLGAGAALIRDVEPGAQMLGAPAQNARDEARLLVILKNLPKVWPKITRLLKQADGGG